MFGFLLFYKEIVRCEIGMIYSEKSCFYTDRNTLVSSSLSGFEKQVKRELCFTYPFFYTLLTGLVSRPLG